MIKALIFDFDGLVIDTEACDYQAWLEIYREFDLDYPKNEWQQLIGTYSEIPVPLDRLDHLRGPINRAEVDARRIKRSTELSLSQELLPGVMQYLEQAQKLGLLIAIASSSPRSWLDSFLVPRKLTRYFNVIITGDTVSQVKPDPEIFNSAIGKLGVKPFEALILEDSVNGLKAARAAEVRCVIIPSSLTRGMDFKGADLILDSLVDLSLNELLEKFNQRLSGEFKDDVEKRSRFSG